MMPVSNKGETKMSDTKETKKSAPVAKASVGLQTASIWKNESEGRVFYNVSFDRRYRDAGPHPDRATRRRLSTGRRDRRQQLASLSLAV